MTETNVALKSFSMQMRDFFGYRPGQGAKDFAAELKTLSQAEKTDFAEMLNSVGFTCIPPTAAPVAA